MKIQLEDLLPKVKKCEKFTSTKEFVPALQCIKFEGNKMKATDGVRGIIMETNYEFTEAFFLPATPLATVLSNIKSKEIDITLEEKEVLLKAGRFKARMRAVPERGYSFPIQPTEATLLPDNFFSEAKMVHFSVSHDETKSMIRVIHFDEGSKFYSTDNNKISCYTTKFQLDKDLQFVVPDILLEVMDWEDKVEAFTLSQDGRLWFWYDSYLVFVMQSKKDFPPYKRFLETFRSSDLNYCSYDKSLMEMVLNAASPFCASVGEKSRLDVEVLPDDKIIFQAENSTGKLEENEEVPCKGGEPWKFIAPQEDLLACMPRMDRFSYSKEGIYFNDSKSGLECLVMELK